MKKRGMSAVVTTLIIILLTIVAIGIVWVVVKNILDKGSDEISLTGLTLDLEIVRAVVDGDTLSVTVKRNPGDGNLVGINFVISDGEKSTVVRRDTTLAELGVQTFTFTLSQLPVDDITSIAIAPIFETASGKEILGDAIDTITYSPSELGSGGGSDAPGDGETPPEECTPTTGCIIDGLECGNFIDDCGTQENCGDCNSLYGPGFSCGVDNMCYDDACVAEDPTVTCSGFNCGNLTNNCGQPVNCSIVAGGTCVELFGITWECIANVCVEITAINSGVVLNAWPPGTGLYFDAVNLPTDLPGSGYTGYWAAFPQADNTRCFQIVGYVQDTDVYEYAIAELSVDLVPLPLVTGHNYYIWETQIDCVLYTPWL